MENVYLGIVLAPLVASIIAGLFGRQIGRAGSHWVTIIGVAISFVLSLLVFKDLVIDGHPVFNGSISQFGPATFINRPFIVHGAGSAVPLPSGSDPDTAG